MVTQSDIVTGLRQLGIRAGDGLIVHSSLSSFGRVEGGSQSVIDALMEVVTPAGTIMMPSFNHYTIFDEGGPGYFHPSETSTVNGKIPDTFWRLPGVFRSLNPSHAFAAWGKHARRYTAAHHRTLTMGPRSPLGLLHADDGYGLLLGVGYEANTFHHIVEVSIGAGCLGLRTEAYPVVLPDGCTVIGRTWGWREQACPITDQTVYQKEMEARGLHQVVTIGNCRATLFRLMDCFQVIEPMLRDGIDGLPPCHRCTIRPRTVPQTTISDWDAQTQSLLPESTAWSY